MVSVLEEGQAPADLLPYFLPLTSALAFLLAFPLGIGVSVRACARTWSGTGTRARSGTAAAGSTLATATIATTAGEQRAGRQGEDEPDDQP